MKGLCLVHVCPRFGSGPLIITSNMDAFYVPGTVLSDFPAFFDFAGVEIEKPQLENTELQGSSQSASGLPGSQACS